jgi:hypothetical protein
MLKRVNIVFRKGFVILRAQGLSGMLDMVFRRLVPRHLSCYEDYRQFFHGKNGLEIGGPSGIFSWNGLLPIYTVAERIDNCNFSNDTTWEGRIAERAKFHFDKRRMPGNQ